MVDGSWILGLVQRDNGAFRLEICPGNRRDKETLLGLVTKHVKPGTTIHTDCWRAYNGLVELGYPHYTVNHSKNFVDPETGCHTQMIESHWRALKRRLTRGGIRKESLADHFAEHIFMKDKEDVFMALVREIVKQYE